MSITDFLIYYFSVGGLLIVCMVIYDLKRDYAFKYFKYRCFNTIDYILILTIWPYIIFIKISLGLFEFLIDFIYWIIKKIT